MTPPKKHLGPKPERPGSLPLPISGEAFQLVPHGAALAVVQASPGQQARGEVLTRAWLEQALCNHCIPTVPASALCKCSPEPVVT
jgi:hypothetical protein